MKKNLAFALLAATLIVPQTASALENEDLLALVAMPLAVAAVSEVADVPMNELMNVVALLNAAAVPPPQFVEVIRYLPVALVEDTDTNFVEFVRVREEEGLRGTQLVAAIEDHLRADIPAVNLDVSRPRVDIDEDFVFARRESRSHPHGGPPGQLKKERGVQTGAEIVHGATRGSSRVHGDDRDDDRQARVARRERKEDRDDVRRVTKERRSEAKHQVERGRVDDRDDHGRGRGGDHGGNGNGKGNWKGKGKGKG